MENHPTVSPVATAPKIKNIYQRMIEVQKLATVVQKTDVVKMSANDKGYKAVTHDEVARTLHLPLAECGVFMLPDVVNFGTKEFEQKNQYGQVKKWYRTDIEIVVRWINVDDPTDFIESKGGAFALDTSDKSFAKAYSLALKIVLLKVHLLESRDGEEAREFEQDEPEEQTPPPQGLKPSGAPSVIQPANGKKPAKVPFNQVLNGLRAVDGPPPEYFDSMPNYDDVQGFEPPPAEPDPEPSLLDQLANLCKEKQIKGHALYAMIPKVLGGKTVQHPSNLSFDELTQVVSFVKNFVQPKKPD